MKKQSSVRKRAAKSDGQRVIDEAAGAANAHPQHQSTLRDQRDRTTGADQASRADMHATDPASLRPAKGAAPSRPKGAR